MENNITKNWFGRIPLVVKIIILIIVLGGGYFAYNKINNASGSKVKYTTASATQGTLISTVTGSGSVTATNTRIVTTTASGVVNKILVKEGQTVTTGTPIMSINLDLDGQQQLQQAYASLLSAQNSLQSAQDRLYSLQSTLTNTQNIFQNQAQNSLSSTDPTYIEMNNNFLSAQAAFDDQKNAILQSQAALSSARLAYQAAGATVYSPISGTVSAISLAPGMILNPTSNSANSTNSSNAIAVINTAANPAVTVALTEMDAPNVKVGDQATITLDSFADKTFTGKVIAVNNNGTVSSGVVNYPTTIVLDEPYPGILSNMSATANIITNIDNDVILVPSTAVQTVSGSSYVRELVNGQLTNIPVTAGKSDSTNTEILSGVNVGDTVVTAITTPSSAGTSTSTSTSSPFSSLGRGGFGGAAVRIGGGAATGR